MKLRERPRNIPRQRGKRGPDKRPRKLRSEHRYDRDTTQSEAFKLEDYLLPPCSVIRTDRTKRTAWIGEGQKTETRYDATPTIAASRQHLTPIMIDKIYEIVLQTHSLECAAGILCIPTFTVQRWMQEGKKVAEDIASGKPHRRQHVLQYELYIRITQARFVKLAEKRARILRNKNDSSAFRTFKVLEALDTENFGFNRGKSTTAADALPLADEAYM
jgi:hypothetical protein